MTKAKPAKPTPPAPRPATAQQKRAIEAAVASLEARPARATLNITNGADGVVTISNPIEDGPGWHKLLSDTFGTSSDDFSNQSLNRVMTAVKAPKESVTQLDANAAIALMAAIAPRNELETVIGEQIIAAHTASLDFLSRARLNAGQYVESAAAYVGMATKVSRTMAAHVEALAKLRSGGKQQVIVKHVYVDARGGQNVIATGGLGEGESTFAGQPHESGFSALPDATLWSEDEGGLAMPLVGAEREEALQTPRRS